MGGSGRPRLRALGHQGQAPERSRVGALRRPSLTGRDLRELRPSPAARQAGGEGARIRAAGPRAAAREGIADGQCGAITAIQRFGAALHVTGHCHAIVLEAVTAPEPNGIGSSTSRLFDRREGEQFPSGVKPEASRPALAGRPPETREGPSGGTSARSLRPWERSTRRGSPARSRRAGCPGWR